MDLQRAGQSEVEHRLRPAIFDTHGVAGIYGVTTAEGYRRRGIDAVLAVAALEAGGLRGLHIGALQAAAPGGPVHSGITVPNSPFILRRSIVRCFQEVHAEGKTSCEGSEPIRRGPHGDHASCILVSDSRITE